VKSIYLNEGEIQRRKARNEAFWTGKLADYPLMWITAPDPKHGSEVPPPPDEESLWTDVDYVVRSTHARLAQTYFAGDSLPVCNPWLGPDQFAGWLGADLLLKPRQNTSWASAFVQDWEQVPPLSIHPENKWWTLYLDLLKASAKFGMDKWITAYPDIHGGIDALCAIRGPENLMLDRVASASVRSPKNLGWLAGGSDPV
jgi:hypothetical protein